VTSVNILLIKITLYAGASMYVYSLGVFNLGAVETEGICTISKLLI